MAADNVSLGQFNLDGIPPAPRGIPKIEVTFDIDANGILNVTAQDKASGVQQKITITASTNMGKAEVEQKVQEAKRYEAEDRRRKELVEARNAADQVVYQTEKMLRDLGDKVPVQDRTTIAQAAEELKKAKDGDDMTRIRQLTEKLQQASYALSQQMYAQSQPSGGPAPEQPPQGPNPSGDDYVEGEFREV